jgi:hypothetical protein
MGFISLAHMFAEGKGAIDRSFKVILFPCELIKIKISSRCLGYLVGFRN